MADDLVLKAGNEAAAAQREVVALVGAAVERHTVHGAGIINVHDVAVLRGAVGHGLGGAVLAQQAVDAGLDVRVAGGDVCLLDGQSGHIVRQGDIVLCSDAGAVTVCIQTVAVGEILVVKAVHRAVLRLGGGGGSGRGTGRRILLFGQGKAGCKDADRRRNGQKHAEQGFGRLFQEKTSCKKAAGSGCFR